MATRSRRAILFDLDGVIVDSEPLHHRAFEIALRPHDVPGIPFEVYAEHFSSRGGGLEYAVRTWPGVEPSALQRRKQEIYRQLLHGQATLIAGVEPVVACLARAWPLAIATNSPRAEAHFILERFHLQPHFSCVIGREDYALGKPAPDAFLAAAERLDAAAADCLVIEDAYKGLAAALAAGMPCVMVPNLYTRGGDFAGARAVLASLEELTEDFVRGIFAGA